MYIYIYILYKYKIMVYAHPSHAMRILIIGLQIPMNMGLVTLLEKYWYTIQLLNGKYTLQIPSRIPKPHLS